MRITTARETGLGEDVIKAQRVETPVTRKVLNFAKKIFNPDNQSFLNRKLQGALKDGDFDGVKKAIEAGASVAKVRQWNHLSPSEKDNPRLVEGSIEIEKIQGAAGYYIRQLKKPDSQ